MLQLEQLPSSCSRLTQVVHFIKSRLHAGGLRVGLGRGVGLGVFGGRGDGALVGGKNPLPFDSRLDLELFPPLEPFEPLEPTFDPFEPLLFEPFEPLFDPLLERNESLPVELSEGSLLTDSLFQFRFFMSQRVCVASSSGASRFMNGNIRIPSVMRITDKIPRTNKRKVSFILSYLTLFGDYHNIVWGDESNEYLVETL